MILIQVILVLAFIFFLLQILANPNSYQIRAWKKILGFVFAIFAIVAVLSPDLVNRAAHAVGVGRGADLLLYIVALSFIFVTSSIYINFKQEQRRFVKLARKVAILEANTNKTNKKTKD